MEQRHNELLEQFANGSTLNMDSAESTLALTAKAVGEIQSLTWVLFGLPVRDEGLTEREITEGEDTE